MGDDTLQPRFILVCRSHAERGNILLEPAVTTGSASLKAFLGGTGQLEQEKQCEVY